MKKGKDFLQLLPAVFLVGIAAYGFLSTTPVFSKITMPVMAEELDTSDSKSPSDGETAKKKKATPKEEKEDAAARKAAASASSEGDLSSSSYTEPTGGYKDGTYQGSAQGFGGLITVEVVISSQKISSITVVSASGETPSYLESAKGVIPSMLSAQSPNVDTVSGATYSSNGIREAVKNALAKASGSDTSASGGSETPNSSSSGNESTENTTSKDLEQEEFEDGEGEYVDGTYYGSAQGFGGEITVQVVIKKHAISSIVVTDGNSETASYLKKAESILDDILEKQSPNVDTVSGATYSSNGIREAVKKALKKAVKSDEDEAEEEETTPTPTPTPILTPTETPAPTETPTPTPGETWEEEILPDPTKRNGTFAGSEVCYDENGFSFLDYTVDVTVTYVNDVITAIASPVADTDDTNLDYLNFAANGSTRTQGILPQILGGKSVEEVDTVSGATCSSKAIISAIKKAQENAQAAISSP